MPRSKPQTAPAAAPSRKAPKPAPPGESAPPPRRRNTTRAVPPPEDAPAEPPALPLLLENDSRLTDDDRLWLAQLEHPECQTIMARRARVARLHSRKLSIREIAQAVGVGSTTVFRDLKAIDEHWRREATDSITDMRARELAELRDMEYQAATALSGAPTEDAKIRWMAERRQLKARIASLLGLDAPRTFAGEIEVKDGGLSTLERRALAAEILAGHAAAGEEGADGEQ